MLRTNVQYWLCRGFPHCILLSSAYGEVQHSEPVSCCCVTANSILSPAHAGSACASEVEAVPSDATVGPDRPWRKGGALRIQSCYPKVRIPLGNKDGEIWESPYGICIQFNLKKKKKEKQRKNKPMNISSQLCICHSFG